ncbi:D-2-hydroxyacid dehydrogenase [Deinococcus arcticus]|uniref:Hydroxyacid dehydrogenase n=1 Tax=Deinococcus arcticus TaxID=2136176 RepID=A0A2T3W8H0_9DEIO|nr:D-2-hydroxyacid dehydrogenase [Deinococcus arcticus]PTA68211.1 hydroxyacid dehydrogenase [Deinococcus arcticus]
MRVLVPDAPEFRALAAHDEGSVPGVDFAFYSRTEVPQGPADGAVLWLVGPDIRRQLLATPGLRWVLTLTAGIEHVQGQLPEGAALYNASRLHDRAVATHVLAGMLAASRGLHLFRDAQARRQWASPALPGPAPLTTLDGQRVVLWGHGHIGRQLEGMLSPLGAQVSGIRSGTPAGERQELLAAADWVVLLLPGTEQTRGAVNAQTLSGLKPGAWLCNVGRGPLIVTDDLVRALQDGTLGGAVLDVTDPEPLPADHVLWTLPNVILTPHIASTTADLVARGAELTRNFLIDLQQGGEPEGRVEVGSLY